MRLFVAKAPGALRFTPAIAKRLEGQRLNGLEIRGCTVTPDRREIRGELVEPAPKAEPTPEPEAQTSLFDA